MGFYADAERHKWRYANDPVYRNACDTRHATRRLTSGFAEAEREKMSGLADPCIPFLREQGYDPLRLMPWAAVRLSSDSIEKVPEFDAEDDDTEKTETGSQGEPVGIHYSL